MRVERVEVEGAEVEGAEVEVEVERAARSAGILPAAVRVDRPRFAAVAAFEAVGGSRSTLRVTESDTLHDARVRVRALHVAGVIALVRT